VPEASGAAWLEIDGKARLVVVGDSGNHGAYGLVDPESGETVETGRLPLGAASDDIEGAASRGGRLYGLTSSGWIRVWERKAGGFALVGAPYPIGPVDLPDGKNQSRPPAGGGMVCGAMAGNCGRNYEGLCLAPAPAPHGGCVGFAASKADGHLYCLTDEHGALAVHRDRAIAITRPGALADCAFSDDGTLWAASNLFDLGNVYRVARWDDPAAATVERIAALVVGFPEVIAVRGDIVYRMSDLNGAPSLMGKYRCRR
jgi:outer membrane protein assembly factor BamB